MRTLLAMTCVAAGACSSSAPDPCAGVQFLIGKPCSPDGLQCDKFEFGAVCRDGVWQYDCAFIPMTLWPPACVPDMAMSHDLAGSLDFGACVNQCWDGCCDPQCRSATIENVACSTPGYQCTIELGANATPYTTVCGPDHLTHCSSGPCPPWDMAGFGVDAAVSEQAVSNGD